jgi:hypothetical protein
MHMMEFLVAHFGKVVYNGDALFRIDVDHTIRHGSIHIHLYCIVAERFIEL